MWTKIVSQLKSKGHCLSCPVRHRSIFSEIPEESLEDKIQNFHTSVITFDAGEFIFAQNGDSSESAYTLRKGLIKICKSLPDGRVQIVRVLAPGDLFGFDGFADEKYNHSATALTECEVCRLPLADLATLRTSHSEIDKSIISRIIKNIRQAEDMMLELGAKKAPEKLASFILNLSQPLNVKSDKSSGLKLSSDAVNLSNKDEWLSLPLTRSEIGSLLGLTIETVSRFLSEWKRKGFIKESKGNIQILDAENLKAVACVEGSCDQ